MIQHDGMWWPDGDKRARPIIVGDCGRDVRFVLDYVKGRDCIVQAGGNVGVYALALADHFQQVITFEPDPANYECLRKNLEARDAFNRVTEIYAGLGAEEGRCQPIVVEADNCGAHRVGPSRSGSVALVALDSLNLRKCDAIWLDVEGFELFALRGAENTIRKHKPVLICEEKGLGEVYGVGRHEIEEYLGAFGYDRVAGMANDRIYRFGG